MTYEHEKNKEIANGYTPSPWLEREILKTPTTNAGKIKLLFIIFVIKNGMTVISI